MIKKMMQGFYFISRDSGSSEPEDVACVWIALFSTLIVISIGLVVEFSLKRIMHLDLGDTYVILGVIGILSSFFFIFYSYIKLRIMVRDNVINDSLNVKTLKTIAVIYAFFSIFSVFFSFFVAMI